MLSREAIETDHELEQIADTASGELAKHRWRWTLDESNPDRVSILAYARAVGRSDTTIGASVRGYAQYRSDSTGTRELTGNIPDYVSRAHMGEETRAAAQAVSKARGVATDTARTNYRDETRRVRETARQLAEERGTTVEEEAPKVAEVIVRAEKAAEATEAERREHTDLRFFEMERYLISAKRELLRAVKLAPQVQWDSEHKELLGDTLGNVKALLGLLDSAIAGISSTDWDAEFAKIGDQL